MTLIFPPTIMTQRTTYQPNQWASPPEERSYATSTNRVIHRDFPNSAQHPDDLGFAPSGSNSIIQSGQYVIPPQASIRSINPSYSNGHPASVNPMDISPTSGSLASAFDQSFRRIDRSNSRRLDTSAHQGTTWPVSSSTTFGTNFGTIGSALSPNSAKAHSDYEPTVRSSPDWTGWDQDPPSSRNSAELPNEGSVSRGSGNLPRSQGRSHSQRRPPNRDEFDGPHQFLERPSSVAMAAQEQELPHVPTNLLVQEQDDILFQVNASLSQCAFDFVAKYQFPIPLESDKRPVSRPADREWTEWVYLLKRLATKRRIPARVLYKGQIKQLVTVLENSLEMRHAAKQQSRPLKDDRNVLQLISAGIQVAKMLMDGDTMTFLDGIYARTEALISQRKNTPTYRA